MLGQRYTPEELEAVIAAEGGAVMTGTASRNGHRPSPGSIAPGDADAPDLSWLPEVTADDVPALKLDELRQDRTFRETEGRRRNFKDNSASAYDLSLATRAAYQGWTDRQIVALCLMWRQQHGEDTEKLRRPDYAWKWLLKPAREAVQKGWSDMGVIEEVRAFEAAQTAEAAEGAAAAEREAERSLPTPEKLAVITRLLRKWGGLRPTMTVIRIVKYGRAQSCFAFFVDGPHGHQEIEIGPPSTLRQPRLVGDILTSYLSTALNPPTLAKWNRLVDLVTLAAEEDSEGEMTVVDEFHAYLRGVLKVSAVISPEDREGWAKAIDDATAYQRSGSWFVNLLRLKLLFRLCEQHDLEAKTQHFLRRTGFRSILQDVTVDCTRHERNFWTLLVARFPLDGGPAAPITSREAFAKARGMLGEDVDF